MNDYIPKAQETHVIYLIEINGKFYVGLTGDFKKRKKQHLKELRANRHTNSHLQNAFNKHGESKTHWQILELCSFDEVYHAERKWIKAYDSYHNGFNRTEGGDGLYGIPATWNGIEYPSILAAASAVGINDMTMAWRLEQGYTCDSDLKGRGSKFAKSIIWGGVLYVSISEAARAIGVANRTLNDWIEKGYTCNEDTPEKVGRPPKPVLWNGKRYSSPQEAAEMNNIPLASLYHHLNHGYSCDEDIKIRGTWSQEKVVFNGIEYESMIACANALGINRSTLRKRLKRMQAKDV